MARLLIKQLIFTDHRGKNTETRKNAFVCLGRSSCKEEGDLQTDKAASDWASIDATFRCE
jgi:hypothetical protein